MNIEHFIIGLLLIGPIASMRYKRNSAAQQQRGCLTPLGDMGTCISLRYCPEVVNLFTKLPQNSATQYSMMLQSICGQRTTNDNYPIVCCTRAAINTNTVTTEATIVQTTQTSNTTDQRSGPNWNRVPVVPGQRNCQSPDALKGVCKPLANCDVLLDRLKSDTTNEDFKTFLRSSHVVCDSINTNVCCPISNTPTKQRDAPTERIPQRLPTEEEGCGYVRQPVNKVVGGVDSQIGAWPWIALIGYNAYSLTPFRCGGTLITARHVITAAHCILNDLSFVRLGEYDLGIETETKHVDINVIKVERHPEFGTADKRNDIAMLTLEKNVEFTELISPICLPASQYMRTKSFLGYNPYIAGWGRTTLSGSPSAVLQQLEINVFENSVCRDAYQRNRKLFSDIQFDQSVICAGILAGGKDSCKGDSGGPLMIAEPYKGVTRYYLLGVVSYGIGCGEVGIPGVYMNMQYFMDWIIGRIAEI